MTSTFFELLQVAIGNRSALTSCPTDEEWDSLYNECEKHALLGIAFAGVERLPKEQCPPFDVLAEWLHDAQVTKERNEKQNRICVELCEDFKKSGFDSCILKGQSNLICYPENLRDLRTSGDIDIWVRPSSDFFGWRNPIMTVVAHVQKVCKEKKLTDEEEIRYHHIDMNGVYDSSVEVHFRPQYLDAPYRNSRFQVWASDSFSTSVCNYGFPVPSVSFNVVYQLVHLQRHLMDEGIGLRQLLDYYFVLQCFADEGVERREECLEKIERFGMKRFASAMMYVLLTVFAMPDEYIICMPDEKAGAFVLSEILIGGNFGRSDTRFAKASNGVIAHAWGKTCHNFMFLRYFPEEVLWEPIFRVYHWVWRKCELWKI